MRFLHWAFELRREVHKLIQLRREVQKRGWFRIKLRREVHKLSQRGPRSCRSTAPPPGFLGIIDKWSSDNFGWSVVLPVCLWRELQQNQWQAGQSSGILLREWFFCLRAGCHLYFR